MSQISNHLLTIQNFDELIHYLEDKLDWPLQEYGFDELTFSYEPGELGLKDEDAAKVKAVHQLRPLNHGQPWGIFFVEFEKKKLPVVVLRRILRHLVVKKRSSANKADGAAWNTEDLLFVTAFGEEENSQREIAFAHFHQSPGDMPTLRVLGWDGSDTPLKLTYLDKVLQQRLRWPDDPSDHNAWREQWRSPFKHRIGHVIRTADALAVAMATLARSINDKAKRMLAAESETGPLKKLHKAFKTALINDLTEENFADTYAQTITYGLLTAAISRTEGSGGQHGTLVLAESITDMVPITNPFLKEMLQTFLTVGGRKGGIDFDELGIQDVVDLLRGSETDLPAILRDFGNKTHGEDPVIHFYEHFLAAYNKKLKVKRGVFYTPKPVVSYIARSVHELLQTEFGLEDGLASTVTWGEMVERNSEINIPTDTDSDTPFVKILDPATGTATFLVEVIDVVHKTMTAKWRKEGRRDTEIAELWNGYVPKHLLPRLYGYELMMAPYAIAHMKIGLKLFETGYQFTSEERVRVFLTNALEPASDDQQKLVGIVPALAYEAEAVNAVKRNVKFTVVVGNPPYSGISSNMSDEIINLVEPYKSINGVSLGERKIWAQDDYKKFIRFSQLRIESSGCGLIAYITNHGYINEPTSRGMRHNLLETFSQVSVIDLHGSLKKREVCPDGTPDKNVFDIEPGVAISFFRCGSVACKSVSHGQLWGLRNAKYNYLMSHTLKTTDTSSISPTSDFYLFVPQNDENRVEFSRFISIRDVFEAGSNGIQTSRDDVVYGFSEDETRTIIEDFRASERDKPTIQLREKYWPGKRVANYERGDTRGWRLPFARDRLREDRDWEKKLRQTLYRPFDWRVLYYAEYMIDWPRSEIMNQMLRPNLSLCVGRAGSAADNQEWNIVFVSNTLVDMNLFYRGGNVNYPVSFAASADNLFFCSEPRANFKALFLKVLSQTLGVQQETDNFGLPCGFSPNEIIYYIYAIFFSLNYRARYADFLKLDFPHIPLTSSLELFRSLSKLGGDLVALHLLEAPTVNNFITTFTGNGDNFVPKKPIWKDNAVWINPTQRFEGVPENVWNFHIGGYQVCEKWLKDRKGRTLSDDDITHYQRIVVALNETIRIMAEIDQVIDEHGGWPIK